MADFSISVAKFIHGTMISTVMSTIMGSMMSTVMNNYNECYDEKKRTAYFQAALL